MIIIEKEIEGFENYIICTDGTVHNKKGHNISSWKDNVGYLQVKLSKEGKWYYKRVHMKQKGFIWLKGVHITIPGFCPALP